MLGLGVLGLVGFAVWIWALVDALRRPASEWEAARQNQVVWVLVVVLATAVGASIYLLVARPQLEDAATGHR